MSIYPSIRADGEIAWHADIPSTANPYNFGTRAHDDWAAGWEAAQCAWEDADAGISSDVDLGGWSPSAEMLAERRAFGITALD